VATVRVAGERRLPSVPVRPLRTPPKKKPAAAVPAEATPDVGNKPLLRRLRVVAGVLLTIGLMWLALSTWNAGDRMALRADTIEAGDAARWSTRALAVAAGCVAQASLLGVAVSGLYPRRRWRSVTVILLGAAAVVALSAAAVVGLTRG
jgi:hypothetical protein